VLTLEQRNELIEEILGLVQVGRTELPEAASQLLSADWALVLESTPSAYRQSMWALVPEEIHGDVLPNIREETLHELLKALGQQQIIDSTQLANSEQTVSVLAQLSTNDVDAVMASIEEPAQTSTIKAAMEYDANQVGRHAIRDFFRCQQSLLSPKPEKL
jgi:Mg/Co/Ni transporter MgtE